MLEDRRTLGLAETIEEAERLFIEDFDTWDMTGYYLYSKLWRSGVSGHIGTGGAQTRRTGGFDFNSTAAKFELQPVPDREQAEELEQGAHGPRC
jgi:hypothetical protein